MTDCCHMIVSIHKDDHAKAIGLLQLEVGLENDEELVNIELPDMNYGGTCMLDALLAMGVRFVGCHSSGDDYDAQEFFSTYPKVGPTSIWRIPTSEFHGIIVKDFNLPKLQEKIRLLHAFDAVKKEIFASWDRVPMITMKGAYNVPEFAEKDIVSLVRAEYQDDGAIEVDDEPFTSESEEGMYVQAWVWLCKDEYAAESDVTTGTVTHDKPNAVELVKVSVPWGHDPKDLVTCGTCHRAWDEKLDPAPSAMCPWCHGRGYSTHPVIVLSTDNLQGRC